MATGSARVQLSGHLETLRPYDLVVTPLVAASGAALAPTDAVPVGLVLTAAAAALLAWAGGLYAADYLGRDDDRRTKPHRPIPSGRLPEATARRCALGAVGSAVAVTTAINWHGLLFFAMALVGQAAYDLRLKGCGLWGDLAIGGAGWTCGLLTAATLTVPWPPLTLLPVALALGLQGTFSNTLLAIGDLNADRVVGRRTVPVRYGIAGAVRIMAVCSLLCYLLSVAAPSALHRTPRPAFTALLILAGGLAVACVSLLTAARASSPERGAVLLARATALHFYERILLPGAFVAQAVGPATAVVATATAASVLALTPRPMLAAPPVTASPPVPAHSQVEPCD